MLTGVRRQEITTSPPGRGGPRPRGFPSTASGTMGLLNWPRGCRPRRAPKNKCSLVFVSLYQASPPLGVGLRLGAIFLAGGTSRRLRARVIALSPRSVSHRRLRPVPPDPGSNLHFCFAAPTRAAVDQFHVAALGAGGTDNGAPGLRVDYGADYYAAFAVDPDGYRIEAYCGG